MALLSMALMLWGGVPMLAHAEEDGIDAVVAQDAQGDVAWLTERLGLGVDAPQGAQAPSLAAILAQADDSTELVVHTEQELRSAVKNVPQKTVIVLGEDITLTGDDPLTLPQGSDLTLELNDHVLGRELSRPLSRGCVVYISEHATLSITDHGVFGLGTITGGWTQAYGHYGYGGGIENHGTLSMTNGTIQGNRADRGAGVANCQGSKATFVNTWIVENEAYEGGGIYNMPNATLSFAGGMISKNSASEKGGGIFNSTSGNVALTSTSVTYNEATDGGGVFDGWNAQYDAPVFHISNTTISYNDATNRGGGIYGWGPFMSEDPYHAPMLTLDGNTKVSENTAGAEGGGIYLESCYAAQLTNARVTNNKSGGTGGGIYAMESDIGSLRMQGIVVVKGNVALQNDEYESSNVCFASPSDVIQVTGPFSDRSEIYVTFDSMLYRTVTEYYESSGGTTDEDGSPVDAIDPSDIFFSEGDRITVLENGEVKIVTRVTYVDENDAPHTITDYVEVTDSFMGNLGPGEKEYCVASGNVTLAERPNFKANSSLIVMDGAKLTCSKGLAVPKSGSLTIYGQEGQSGIIVADARSVGSAAGIGSSGGLEAGSITINGANVYAYGGDQGAGIGCGGNGAPYGNDHNESGPFILNRGYVEATGGSGGSGVGHGLPDYTYAMGQRIYAKWSSNFDIYIHGGTLVANGGGRGPGIGTSNFGGFTLYVDGGEVVATGGTNGAGIGSCYHAMCYDQSDLTFAGGKVTATGGPSMPGIGFRDEDREDYYDRGNSIVFSGGIVEYTKGSSASNPLGGMYDPSSTVDTMVLAGTSADDAQRVLANKRWDTLRDSQYSYIRVEPCDHYGANAVHEVGKWWRLECPWCQDSMMRGWPIHYQPGEGSGEMVDSFISYAPGDGGFFTLPTATTFVAPRGKEFVGWKIGNTIYAPGDTIKSDGEVTAVAQWAMTWASVQAFLNDPEAGDDPLVLEADLVASASDKALTIPAGRNVVLDLNGHKIDRNLSNPTPQGYVMRAEGTLAVIGDGIITGGNNSSAGADSGGGVNIAKGASFTLQDATISGNKAIYGAGVYTRGEFLFESGVISKNTAGDTSSQGSGGGVMVNGGTFTMCSGGEVSNNASASVGGGVMVQSGTFELDGGSITGNAAGEMGGGVCLGLFGAMKLNGQPSVKDNTVEDAANNVFLQDPNKSPLLVGDLGDQCDVGVNTERKPYVGAPVVITSEFSGEDASTYFSSDDPAYVVDLNEQGEVILGLPVTVSFDPGDEVIGEMLPVTKASGSVYEIPACSFRHKLGRSFIGWQLGDRILSPNDVIAVDKSLTLMALWADTYPVWVGDTQVSESNKGDVLGDGTVRYDPETATLTLNDFAGVASTTRPAIYATGIDLTVAGSGSVALKQGVAGYGIQVQGGSLSVGGDLDVEGGQYGIFADNGVTFTHGTVRVSVDDQSGTGVCTPEPNASITVARDIELLEVSTKGQAFNTGGTLTVILEENLSVKAPEDGSLTGPYALIVHVENAATATVTAREGLAYTGSDQELVSYEVEGGTILFGLSADGTFGEMATAKDAGTYQVYYRVKGDRDHFDIPVTGPVEVTIAKAVPEVTVTAPEPVNDNLDAAAVILHRDGGPDGAVTIDEAELSYGTHTYHWTFVPDDTKNYETATGTVEITVTGHVWGEPTYEWSPGVRTVKATRICENDPTHQETETAPVSWRTTKQPTCTEWGQTTYTAAFENPAFETQTMVRDTASPTGHVMSDEVQITPIREPSCTKDGSSWARRYCSKCGSLQQERYVVVEKLGHDWGEPTYTWGEDNATVTAERVCTRDKSHVETETVTTKAEATGGATCTEPGEVVYTATFENPAFKEQSKTEESSLLGHDWGEPTYTWSEDNATVAAERVCARDKSHVETETVATTAKDMGEATCTEAGKVAYTATFQNPAFETQTKEVVVSEPLGHVPGPAVRSIEVEATCAEPGSYLEEVRCTRCDEVLSQKREAIPAIGHDWGEPTYDWRGVVTVVATRVCKNDSAHKETERASVASWVSREPTCTEWGQTTYFATFENPAFETQEKKYDLIKPLGHDPSDETVLVYQLKPTCTHVGYAWEQTICKRCGKVAHEHTVRVDMLGHDWGEPTYTWSEDNATVTAKRVCTRDKSHVETETVATMSTSMGESTCSVPGKVVYTATFENPAFEEQSRTVETALLPHEPADPVYENEVSPTCEADGSRDVVTYCSVCGEELSRTGEAIPGGHDWGDWAVAEEPTCDGYGTMVRTCKNDPSHTQTASIEPIGHNWDEGVVTTEPGCVTDGVRTFTCKHNPSHTKAEAIEKTLHETETVEDVIVEATCDHSGYAWSKVRCMKCGEVMTRRLVRHPALGHLWGEPSYEWSADNASVTATRVCERDETHADSETVATTYEVTKAPTCTEPGEATYTAEFENDAYHTRAKTVALDALGHDWQIIETSTGGVVHVTKTCSRCGEVEEYEYEDGHYHEMAIVAAADPSCTEPGLRQHYLCVTCQKLFEDRSGSVELQSADVVIPAHGHIWNEPTYAWSADNGTVVATRVCVYDKGHVETEVARATAEMTNVASCTEPGEIVYSATFKNEAFAPQTKKVNTALLAHTPGNSVLEVTKEPTCEEEGTRDVVTYCSACGNEFSRVHEAVPAKGHEWGEWSVTSVATCEGRGVETRYCQIDPAHVETRQIEALGHDWDEGRITVAPTCSAEGTRIFTCTHDASHTRTESVEKVAHQTAHRTEEISQATCTQGKRAWDVTFCTACGEVIDRQLVAGESLDHDWGVPTYTWSEDNGYVTAKRVCARDDGHVEIETVGTTSRIISAATCTEAGKVAYEASFENKAFANVSKRVELPATGHDWGDASYEWSEDNGSVVAIRSCRHDKTHVETERAACISRVTKEPTCTEVGEVTYVATFKNQSFDPQSKTVEGAEPLGHEVGPAVREQEVPATCEEAGSYELVTHCERCKGEISRTQEDIPATGHDWGEPTYTWSDDDASVTAERVCAHDATHVETETASVTSTVQKEPTETEDGSMLLTVTFANPGFSTQEKVVVIPAKGGQDDPDPEDFSYAIVEGADSTWTRGSGKSVVMVAKRSLADETCFAHFTRVQVDGITLGDGDYDATSGSTVIAFAPTYLQTLATGVHKVTIIFDDGSVETTLTVAESTPDPVKPDNKPSDDQPVTPDGGKTQPSRNAASPTAAIPQTGDQAYRGHVLVALACCGLFALYAGLLLRRTRDGE